MGKHAIVRIKPNVRIIQGSHYPGSTVNCPILLLQLGADVGIVETLTLRNFMCHSKLEFNFNPGTNIIYGKNGSKYNFNGHGKRLVNGSSVVIQ